MNPFKRTITAAGVLAVSLWLNAVVGQAADNPKGEAADVPKVELQSVPNLACGPGGTGETKGKVTGLHSYKGYRIVIYAKCDDVYYVQPTIASPLTDIDDDGSFVTDIHGGQEYVALLVKDDYKPAAQLAQLPAEGVVAKSKAKRAEKK